MNVLGFFQRHTFRVAKAKYQRDSTGQHFFEQKNLYHMPLHFTKWQLTSNYPGVLEVFCLQFDGTKFDFQKVLQPTHVIWQRNRWFEYQLVTQHLTIPFCANRCHEPLLSLAGEWRCVAFWTSSERIRGAFGMWSERIERLGARKKLNIHWLKVVGWCWRCLVDVLGNVWCLFWRLDVLKRRYNDFIVGHVGCLLDVLMGFESGVLLYWSVDFNHLWRTRLEFYVHCSPILYSSVLAWISTCNIQEARSTGESSQRQFSLKLQKLNIY